MIDYSKIYSTKSLDGEVWKDIEGYEGIYQVSNFGRVKSLERYIYNNLINSEILLKERVLHVGRVAKGRYFIVRLSKNGISKSISIHRLVAEAFIPNLLNKPQVDHINANRFDNRVENL